MKKYDTIIKCDLQDNGTIEYENCYLLTYDGCELCNEIDLCGELFFNEYETTNRQVVAKIDNIMELYSFMIKNNLLTDRIMERFNHKIVSKVYVGGEKDYVLNKDLCFFEKQDLGEYIGVLDNVSRLIEYIIENNEVEYKVNNIEFSKLIKNVSYYKIDEIRDYLEGVLNGND